MALVATIQTETLPTGVPQRVGHASAPIYVAADEVPPLLPSQTPSLLSAGVSTGCPHALLSRLLQAQPSLTFVNRRLRVRLLGIRGHGP